RSEAYFVFPLAQGTPGKQCGLAATGVYQPSLRSPWLAAEVPVAPPSPHAADLPVSGSGGFSQELPGPGRDRRAGAGPQPPLPAMESEAKAGRPQ
ncbi:hypothetical protein, partial [Thiolapillus sp.]